MYLAMSFCMGCKDCIRAPCVLTEKRCGKPVSVRVDSSLDKIKVFNTLENIEFLVIP